MLINTLFERFLSQDIEKQPITSSKYTLIMLCLCRNERKRAFSMLAAEISVNRKQIINNQELMQSVLTNVPPSQPKL